MHRRGEGDEWYVKGVWWYMGGVKVMSGVWEGEGDEWSVVCGKGEGDEWNVMCGRGEDDEWRRRSDTVELYKIKS